MDYRDILGFSKKKTKKKVVKKPQKPSVTDNLTEQFGPLMEWSKQDPGPKRWTNNKGLTEFEQQLGGKDTLKDVLKSPTEDSVMTWFGDGLSKAPLTLKDTNGKIVELNVDKMEGEFNIDKYKEKF